MLQYNLFGKNVRKNETIIKYLMGKTGAVRNYNRN